jgi:nucleotide-binding universal stress UspA family protein
MIFTKFSSETKAIFLNPSRGPKPSNIKRILIPVDFSECSENAVRYGLAVGILARAEITLLHAVTLPMQNADFLSNPLASMEESADQRLEQMAAEIAVWLGKETLPSINLKTKVQVGFTGELVLGFANEWEADMIVMGTHGAGRLEGFLLGSNTTHIIEKATCSVLAIPDEAEFTGIKNIVFASDMGGLDRELVAKISDFARLFDAGIDVLTVFTSGSEIKSSKVQDFKEDLLDKFNYDRLAFHVYESVLDDFTEALQNYLDENEADVVVMQMHHRSFMQKLFRSSQTKKMALHTYTPLLALHDASRN